MCAALLPCLMGGFGLPDPVLKGLLSGSLRLRMPESLVSSLREDNGCSSHPPGSASAGEADSRGRADGEEEEKDETSGVAASIVQSKS